MSKYYVWVTEEDGWIDFNIIPKTNEVRDGITRDLISRYKLISNFRGDIARNYEESEEFADQYHIEIVGLIGREAANYTFDTKEEHIQATKKGIDDVIKFISEHKGLLIQPDTLKEYGQESFKEDILNCIAFYKKNYCTTEDIVELIK